MISDIYDDTIEKSSLVKSSKKYQDCVSYNFSFHSPPHEAMERSKIRKKTNRFIS